MKIGKLLDTNSFWPRQAFPISEKSALIPTLLFCLLFTFMSMKMPLHDFANGYFGAHFLAQGQFGKQIYDALDFNLLVSQSGYKDMFVAYYPNTPFWAFAHVPFIIFSDPFIAKIFFNILSSILFVFAIYKLQSEFNINNILILCLPFIFLNSIKNNLLFGQGYFIIFFLITIGLINLRRNKHLVQGLSWALAILLKVSPVILLIYLFIKQKYKTLILTILFILALGLLSLSYLPLAEWQHYARSIFPKSVAGVFYDGFTVKAKSSLMLLKHLFVYDKIFNPAPFYPSDRVFYFAHGLFKVLILYMAMKFTVGKKEIDLNSFSIWPIAMMLLSPGYSSYSSILLIFPLVSIWSSNIKCSRSQKIAFTFLVALYVNIPVHLFWDLALLFKFPKVYLLIAIFCFYYYSTKRQISKQYNYYLLGICFVLFSASFLLKNKNIIHNDYALNFEKSILLKEYKVENNKVVCSYWSSNKPINVHTNLAVDPTIINELYIKDNQIYLKDQKLTDSPDSKRNPMQINEKEIIYMSDKNRAPGFYTLLKIDLK